MEREEHEGYIVNNDDPEKRGRVSVQCQTIVDGETLEWVEPSFSFVDSEGQAGMVFIPNIGSSVTVEIDKGHEAEVTNMHPRWKCNLYPIETFPEEFKDNYPQRRGLKTKEGHVFYFDDTEDQLTMLYRHPSGTEILINNDGQIELKPTGAQSVLIGDGADEPIPLGGMLKTLLSTRTTIYNGHTHALLGAATDIPVVASQYAAVTDAILSSCHKVK